MKNNQPKTNNFEQIDLDNRDRSLTNEQIDLELDKLDDVNKPYSNEFGFEQNHNSRLVNFCRLVSYYTDEGKLNSAISYLEKILGTDALSIEAENYIQSLKTQRYSPNDLVKLKAIYFSLIANHLIFIKTFCSANIFVPKFEINLTKRVFTHNFSFVQAVTFRNIDIKEKEEILKLPFDKAIHYVNKRIEALETLDYQHGTNISLEKIQFYKKIRKSLYNNHKLSAQFSIQENANVKTVEKYKTQNLFKVGLLFATGKMNKYFTINSFGKMVMKENYTAPKIANELGNNINHKYILASIKNYTDKVNGNKNIFNSLDMMNKIIAHCKTEKLEIDPYFLSRLPIE